MKGAVAVLLSLVSGFPLVRYVSLGLSILFAPSTRLSLCGAPMRENGCPSMCLAVTVVMRPRGGLQEDRECQHLNRIHSPVELRRSWSRSPLHKNTSGLSPVMSAPSFPQEICDIVIDALRAEPRALAACSFVSRPWLSTARVHKFHTVHLRSPAHCKRLECILASPVLESGSIAHCVRAVWFGVDSHDTSIGDAAFQQMWRDDRHLAPLLLRFPRICSLQLENVMWTDNWLPRGVADAVFTIAPRLAHLHLNRVVFDASDSIIHLLSACSILRTFQVSYISWMRRSRTVAGADAAQRNSTKMNVVLERITMEPASYSALFSAAALYTRPLCLSAETVEWATSERPRNVVIRNLRAAEAIDVYRRILLLDDMANADDGMLILSLAVPLRR